MCHSISAQLARSDVIKPHEITVFDPKEEHHYQPAYTMVGGGVLGNYQQTKDFESKHIIKSNEEMFEETPGVNWNKQAVQSFDPDNNKLNLKDGSQMTYDYLVVTPGCELRFDQIEGSQAALEDKDCPVGSIYQLEYAYKFHNLRQNFKGGKAIFTLPMMPIKCGGAPQKIMYLSEQTFRQNKVRDATDMHFYTSVGNLFPNCAKYAAALKPIAAEKNIDVHYTNVLTKIDKDNRVATFKNTSNEEISEVEFDLLHVPPPQSAPAFIRESPLAAANGWLAVDHSTLQHKSYSNIYGLGDVCDLPTAKTSAAVFSQTPVVVHNILRDIGSQESAQASYDGYSSCPLFVGDKKLMLIEFKYGGEAKETFSTSQDKPSRSAYHLKKDILPRAYYHYMPKGTWYGSSWFKPKFD